MFAAQDVVLALISLLGGLEYKDQQAAATKALQKCKIIINLGDLELSTLLIV